MGVVVLNNYFVVVLLFISNFSSSTVGLDGAGKTTILYKLKLGEIVSTIPTIGEKICLFLLFVFINDLF